MMGGQVASAGRVPRVPAEALRSGGSGITVVAALREGALALARSSTPRLDAEVLLGHVLGLSRSRLLARGLDPIGAADQACFRDLVARRADGVPVAYLTGSAHFFGLVLDVTPAVLVPRPETELVAAWAIERVGVRKGACDVLDVGTGSGAVAVAVASHATAARIHATDLSRAALAVATANAARLGLADRTAFHRADLLPPTPRRFDVVVANLPYVGADDLCEVAPDVARWEPRAAWYAGRDGLRVVRRLVARLPGRLAAGADVGIEIGWRQGPEAVALVEMAFPGARVALQDDLAGLPRLVTVEGVRDG